MKIKAKERPIGVTILAFLAILGAINAFIYTLQMLHLLPTVIGQVAFYQFSLIGALFWGFLCFIWLGVFGLLWQMHPQGWLFMTIVSGLSLLFADFMRSRGFIMGGNGPDDHHQRRHPDLLHASRDKRCLRDSSIGNKLFFSHFRSDAPCISWMRGNCTGNTNWR